MDVKKLALGCLLLALSAGAAHAQPTTTKPNVSTMGLTNCTTSQIIFGGGSLANPVCRTITGDVTFNSSGVAALANIPASTPMAAGILATVVGAPGAPAGGKINFYADSTALTLQALNASSARSSMAFGNTCSAGQFFSAFSATAGTFTCSTPAGSSSTGPTTQLLTTGTDATYTTPANVKWIEIYMVGGGGGSLGAGDTSAATAPTAGSATCWKASGTACTTPLYQASGGGTPTRSSAPAQGAAGGGVAGSATCNESSTGGGGGGGTGSGGNGTGGIGGGTRMGGSTPGASSGGVAATANSGSGASGGGSSNTAIITGAGGGGGGYCYAIINNPAGTYVYTIGAGGGAGGVGTGGTAGAAGGTGKIFVREHYNF